VVLEVVLGQGPQLKAGRGQGQPEHGRILPCADVRRRAGVRAASGGRAI